MMATMEKKATNFPIFPCLPLISLDDSAEELTTHDVVKGKNTIIDFWTTRCTRCPAALDELNNMQPEKLLLAEQEKQQQLQQHHDPVQRISICCDKLDGARQILEQPDERRWSNMQHYFMNADDKERAKKILGFASVPFYVVLNAQGEIVQLGNKIDWDSILGGNNSSGGSGGGGTCGDDDDNNNHNNGGGGDDKENEDYVQVPAQEDRVFVLDDLDF